MESPDKASHPTYCANDSFRLYMSCFLCCDCATRLYLYMPEVLQRLPKPERLSIPVAGRTLLASTRRWAEPLLEAHKQLRYFLSQQVSGDTLESAYKHGYSLLHFGVTHQPNHNELTSLSSSALILNWLTGRAVGALKQDSSISEAEHWYFGLRPDGPKLSDVLPQHLQTSVLAPLIKLDYGEEFLDILPYAAEVFETSEEILRAYGPSRKSKRAAGVFYTPSDVSDYVVEFLVNKGAQDAHDIGQLTWFDPACGTGAFLLSVLYRVSQENKLCPGATALNYAAKCLYGTDVSPIALQSAAYIVVLASMRQALREPGSLKRSLSIFGRNLLVIDATKISNRKDLGALFSGLALGANFVVSNPPYVRRKANRPKQQGSLFLTEKEDDEESESLYLQFVRMMPQLSVEKGGGGAMVVPLSIACNTRQEFHRVRQMMWCGGEWHLAHYDRTPDSLFGDDVKTRNSIIFYSQETHGEGRVNTTELLRWNSRSRASLFDKVHFSAVPKIYRNSIIPKIGDELGQELLTKLYQQPTATLSTSIMRVNSYSSDSKALLRNANTAYNWLPFELVTSEPVTSSFAKYHYWASSVPGGATLVFSLLHSRFAYWLWRVWGDGFHLTDQFILSLPLSPSVLSRDAQLNLKTLGSRLWEAMQENKVISKNAGVESISYCPYLSVDILDSIDREIAMAYKLPTAAVAYLKGFITKTIVAGRDAEMEVNPALRKWLNKEEKHEAHFAGN
jgi:hypothetical protein